MSTHAKLIIGYTDHMGNWNITKEYYRNSDGYTEAVKPLLLQYADDIEAMNNAAEYDSHQWEEIPDDVYYGDCEFQYYLDVSDKGNVRCSIIQEDWEFYSKYGASSYKVIDEFIIKELAVWG